MPSQISSVSGGSITNMLLAAGGERCGTSASDQEWAALTEDIFDRVRRGSLTTPWLALLASLLLLLPAGAVVAAMTDGGRLVALLLAIVWLGLLVLRGQVIERLMARRYLGAARRAFVDLAGPASGRQNVLCCTDLVLGRPVYFAADGRVFRRTADRA